MNKWGFLRETIYKAEEAGLDKDTGLHRTGLDEYLKVIFPKIEDWIHNKGLGMINGVSYGRVRPDYRSEKLKLIIEFDGLRHYTEPETIQKDIEKLNLFKDLGYSVVNIPYFIQLSKKAVKFFFNVDVHEELFDEKNTLIRYCWEKHTCVSMSCGIETNGKGI